MNDGLSLAVNDDKFWLKIAPLKACLWLTYQLLRFLQPEYAYLVGAAFLST
jgi:hypothetical protein